MANRNPNVDARTRDQKKSDAKAAAPKKVPLPSDFETEVDFLHYARELFSDDLNYDKDNREAGIEDAKFVSGDQWDEGVRQRRTRAKKPVLTINRLPAFVGQIVGNRRMNETQVKVLPDNEGGKDSAVVRQGLIRNIEKTSKADRAYDKALENCVIGGIGWFGVKLDYASDDVFEQDIKLVRYDNPWSIVIDRQITDPTGRDAHHAFIVDRMPRKDFERAYPGKSTADLNLDTEIIDAEGEAGWFSQDDVRVVSFWRMRTRDKLLALSVDGKTFYPPEGYAAIPEELAKIAVNPKTQQPYVRVAPCKYAEMYLMSGADLLDGPYELPISRVPVFRVPAWEINIGVTKSRFGLTRHMKDPQRLHNYWRSTIAEKLMLTPRARWLASQEAVAGREKEWRNAHLSDDPLLVWNGESGQAPVYTQPAQLEVALVQEANMSVQDLRDVSNLHEASLGQQSNEVSGKAIVARQRVGEIGTIIYLDNLNAAIGEAGEVINELIPVAYDTARTIRTLGPEDAEKFVKINDPSVSPHVDLTSGKYTITITTGASYATKRQEAQEAMLAMFNAAPQAMAGAVDLYVANLDFPGAEKMEKRLRKMIPANLIDQSDVDPEEQRAQEQQQQAEQAQQAEQKQIAMAQLQAALAEQQAKTELAQAQARAALAQAEKAEADAFLSKARANTEGAKFELTMAQADKTEEEADAIARGDGPSAQDDATVIGAEIDGAGTTPKPKKTGEKK